MRLTVLNVAYPLAPVGPDAVGGAEQVLTALDSALVQAGHRSLVLASEGSRVEGELLPVPRQDGILNRAAREWAWQACRKQLAQALALWRVHVVHLHGVDFCEYLPAPGVPLLVTLHLPPSFYPREVFSGSRANTFLHCVSATQRRACPPTPQMLPEIENGVAPDLFAARHAKRNYVLGLGRICSEKGFHLGLEAAAAARVPMLLAGQVFPYPAHQEYFAQQIKPRLNQMRRFIGPVGRRRKIRLLAGARCLLVPSLVPETSSLVSMEALACGTPVVAFPSGALADIVEDGKTGFLVSDTREMAAAVARCGSLSAETCRRAARERFSIERMLAKYFEVYRMLADIPAPIGNLHGGAAQIQADSFSDSGLDHAA